MIFRKPYPSAFSIEYLFHNLYEEIRRQVPAEAVVLPAQGASLRTVLRNMLFCLRFRRSIVHVTGDVHYALLGALFAKRVLTVHDLSFLTRTRGWKRRLLKKLWVEWPVRFAHRVTVVSTATKEALLQEVKVPADKIEVVYNFIDPVYRPVSRSFNAACPRILQVGTAFNKNIPALAQALKGIPCELAVIGKLPAETEAVLHANGIRFTQRQNLTIEELFEEYGRADLLSFVSTVEGFGLPVLEAQATGLPVLTSNGSSLPEVAGGGALLVDPLDPAAIRAGILRLVNEPALRAALTAKGFSNVTRFSKPAIAARYLKIYSSLDDQFVLHEDPVRYPVV